MDIPWQFLGSLSAASAIAVLLAVYVGRKLIDSVESRVNKPFESSLTKAEKLYASRVDIGAQVDLDLRNKREAPYRELWRLTGVLPRWPRAKDVTYAKLVKRSAELQDWFFSGGGLYLSTEARSAYGKVQDALNRRPAEDTVISDGEYNDIVDLFSSLRRELTQDLLSRTRMHDLSDGHAR
jgi:short subunit dehydrogenase-like uncharacterized protein